MGALVKNVVNFICLKNMRHMEDSAHRTKWKQILDVCHVNINLWTH